jgi:hypothetical protein
MPSKIFSSVIILIMGASLLSPGSALAWEWFGLTWGMSPLEAIESIQWEGSPTFRDSPSNAGSVYFAIEDIKIGGYRTVVLVNFEENKLTTIVIYFPDMIPEEAKIIRNVLSKKYVDMSDQAGFISGFSKDGQTRMMFTLTKKSPEDHRYVVVYTSIEKYHQDIKAVEDRWGEERIKKQKAKRELIDKL